METKLIRIAEISKEMPKEVFTSLYHYLNKEMLIQCHKELAGNKAAGIDEMIKQNKTHEQVVVALYQAILFSNVHAKPYKWKKESAA